MSFLDLIFWIFIAIIAYLLIRVSLWILIAVIVLIAIYYVVDLFSDSDVPSIQSVPTISPLPWQTNQSSFDLDNLNNLDNLNIQLPNGYNAYIPQTTTSTIEGYDQNINNDYQSTFINRHNDKNSYVPQQYVSEPITKDNDCLMEKLNQGYDYQMANKICSLSSKKSSDCGCD